MELDRYPWPVSIIAGLVGGSIPLMGAATLPGFVLMALILCLPFAWVSLTLGWLGGLVSVCVAYSVISIAQSAYTGLLFVCLHGVPFVILSLARTHALFVSRFFPHFALWHLWVAMACVVCLAVQGHWLGEIQETFTMMQKTLELSSHEAASGVKVFLNFLPGLSGVTWALCILFNLYLAARLNQALGVMIPSRFMICPFEAGFGPIWILVSCGVLALLSQGALALIVWNFFIVLLLPGMIVGFYIVHLFSKTRSLPYLFMFSFYTVVLGFSWLIPIVILIGFLEPWLQLKAKISTLKSHQGE